MKKRAISATEKNSALQGVDYEIYRLSPSEWCRHAGEAILFLAALAYIFYRSLILFLLLAPLGLAYPLYKKKDLKKKRRENLRLQFKDGILILASSLNAGYSVENAFGSSLEELDRIYGKESMISEEFRLIVRKTRMNRTFEEAFDDFALRSGIDDVKNFAEVFAAARRNGGELTKIIGRTADIIGEKIRIHEEIRTLTAAKQLEQKIMNLIPVLMVFYIELTSPGFFRVLYTTLTGRAIMTLCLAAYLFAYWVAGKILEIEV